MAATLTPQDALDYAKEWIKSMPFERVWEKVSQDASSMIWTAAPWRWSISTLPNTALTSGVQDYTISVPGDFLKLERCFVTDTVTTREVKPVSTIPASAILTSYPNYVARIKGTSTLRFDSLFQPLSGQAVTNYLVAWYRVTAPIINNGNLTSAGVLVMDDDWYWVYRACVLYFAYLYADDARAGGARVTVTEGKRQLDYSGQLGVAMAAIETMRNDETVIWMPTAIDFSNTKSN